MGKFHLKKELPDHIAELASYFVEVFKKDGIMTFEYRLKPNGILRIKHDSNAKEFSRIGNPVISLENLGFGSITYTSLDTNQDKKDMGVFTIKSELLKWHDYKIASPAKKKWIRFQETILENKVYISIILSIIALTS